MKYLAVTQLPILIVQLIKHDDRLVTQVDRVELLVVAVSGDNLYHPGAYCRVFKVFEELHPTHRRPLE